MSISFLGMQYSTGASTAMLNDSTSPRDIPRAWQLGSQTDPPSDIRIPVEVPNSYSIYSTGISFMVRMLACTGTGFLFLYKLEFAPMIRVKLHCQLHLRANREPHITIPHGNCLLQDSTENPPLATNKDIHPTRHCHPRNPLGRPS